MRAAFGRLISPPSGVRSPRISRNSVDLPTPLRPTRPTLAPTGSDTDAPSKNFRPQPLNTRLSIWSMGLRRDPAWKEGGIYRLGGRKARKMLRCNKLMRRRKPTLRRPLVVARGLRLIPFRPLDKFEGVERRSALHVSLASLRRLVSQR